MNELIKTPTASSHNETEIPEMLCVENWEYIIYNICLKLLLKIISHNKKKKKDGKGVLWNVKDGFLTLYQGLEEWETGFPFSTF